MTESKLQRTKTDNFNHVFTKIVEKKDFIRELEEVYNKRYKANYEKDGFRLGEVPFKVAFLNAKLSSGILQAVVLVNRQIFLEEIIKEVADIGSIYDIQDGEEQTSFEGYDLDTEEPVVYQLNVELASYVESVNYKDVKVDKDVLKTKPSTQKELEEMFKEYKKVKHQQNKVTKTSYVDLVFNDGSDDSELTFNLGQKFAEDDEPLKAQTHKEVSEKALGKSIGDSFEYELRGKDGAKLAVTVTIKDVYRVKVLTDEEFVELLKTNGSVPEAEREEMTISKVWDVFKGHIQKIYEDNFEEEVRSLTFVSLRSLTEGINYNEKEIDNLKNQFTVQVQKSANEEGVPYVDFVKANFGSQELMEDYVDASQRARVLQAAIYRKIGKDLGFTPTYMQLEGFVKHFLFKLDPNEKMDEELVLQINDQVQQVLGEPLNRHRIVESWASVKAEDTINEMVGLLK